MYAIRSYYAREEEAREAPHSRNRLPDALELVHRSGEVGGAAAGEASAPAGCEALRGVERRREVGLDARIVGAVV